MLWRTQSLRQADRSNTRVTELATKLARPLYNFSDADELVSQLATKKIVMLGEASHGTHEFYAWRRYLSQRLIERHGFSFIAVEGDWPDAARLNQFIQNGGAKNAEEVLRTYHRWPTWMWANTEILRLGDWMRQNGNCAFYGLDIYSLFDSMDAVLNYLRKDHPFLARQVQERFACFDPFKRDEIAYARSTLSFPQGCHDEVMQTLLDLLEIRLNEAQSAKEGAVRHLFDAQQNARVVRNAENYYRAMMRSDANSWNIRDRHMMDTLDQLLEAHGSEAKAIVWAHNTHIGDYSATDMADDGSINIGGLARERHGDENVALVGFGTHRGTVIAGHAWDAPYEVMNVPAGRPGSYEDAFHKACLARSINQFYLTFGPAERASALDEWRGHRAIGVVYDPRHELWGNYVPTKIASRYDAFIFIDQTRGLEPLDVSFERQRFPETWPSGQ